jgi:group I intron endonuclease
MYLYRIVNKESGKQYIGQSVNYKKRWRLHRYYLNNNSHHNEFLQNAWIKYGEEAFRFELITEFQSRDELNTAEALHIEVSGSLYPNGYNLVKGGDVFEISESTRAKLSDAMKGKPLSAATRAKISEALKGKPIRAETRAKISTSNKGKQRSAAARAKISAYRTGRKHSAETRAKISAANRRRQISDETRAKLSAIHKGKLVSEATRAKISDAKKGKPMSEEDRAKRIGKKHNAEARAKISYARKKYWERRKQEKNADSPGC